MARDMFIGEYQHTIDGKGRIALPAKFRKVLEERGVVITRGLDSCLFLYPEHEWAKEAEKLTKLPMAQAHSRAFARHILGGASTSDVDAQGRILGPDYLRKYAGLGTRAVVVGLYNRIEIWSEVKWGDYRLNMEKHTDEIAEKLGELGLY